MRDKEIYRFGEYASRWLIVVGAAAGFFLALAKVDYFWIAIYLGFVLWAVVGSAIKLVALAVVAFTGLRAPSEKRRDLSYISGLTEASALVPVIDACYPLPRIADAYRHVDAGHKQGNVVITMTGHP